MDIIIPTLLAVSQWFSALFVVCTPFIKMALIWFAWQTGIGWLAWSTARFYSNHCAAPGINGFISSLFSMGSPICISAWFSHAAFVVAYITAFIAAVLLIILWLWKRVTQDKNIDASSSADKFASKTNQCALYKKIVQGTMEKIQAKTKPRYKRYKSKEKEDFLMSPIFSARIFYPITESKKDKVIRQNPIFKL